MPKRASFALVITAAALALLLNFKTPAATNAPIGGSANTIAGAAGTTTANVSAGSTAGSNATRSLLGPNAASASEMINPANIAISNYKGNLTPVTIPAATTTLASGVGSLKFKVAAPVAGTVGSADIAINLGAAGVGDTSCIPAAKKLAVGGAYTGGAAMTWLRGNWCGGVGIYATDPSARLTFGTAKSPFLFQRERY